MKKATLILLVLLLCCGVAAPAAAEQGEAPRPEQNAEETVVRESGEPDSAVPAPVQTPEPDPEYLNILRTVVDPKKIYIK